MSVLHLNGVMGPTRIILAKIAAVVAAATADGYMAMSYHGLVTPPDGW